MIQLSFDVTNLFFSNRKWKGQFFSHISAGVVPYELLMGNPNFSNSLQVCTTKQVYITKRNVALCCSATSVSSVVY